MAKPSEKIEQPDQKKESSELTESNIAHTPDAEIPDPNAQRVGKEVLTEEDQKKAS